MVEDSTVLTMVSIKAIIFYLNLQFFWQIAADAADPSYEVISAINDQWKEYDRRSSYSVQVSMFVSRLAYEMTRGLFSASDSLEKEARNIKHDLMAISHQRQMEDVLKSRCVNHLGIPEAIKKTEEDIEHAAACSILEANKVSALETSLTGIVNEFRGRIIKGVRALQKCKTGNDKGNACIANVIKDRNESAELLTKELNTLKEKVLILDDKLPRTIAACKRLASRSLSVLGKLTESIKAC